MATNSSDEDQAVAQNPESPPRDSSPSEEEEPKPEMEIEIKTPKTRRSKLQPSPAMATNSSEEDQAVAQNPESPPRDSSSSEEEEPKPEMEIEIEPPKTRGRPKKTRKENDSVTESGKLSYSSSFQEETKGRFAVPDLVWGKVRSHPWWPGQIFDPSDASELALKHRNKNNLLVAYFGDKTFAWNDSSVLKPFQTNFSKMNKQCKTEAFVTAVNDSLAEISRRVDSALSCSCFGPEISTGKIDNTGIKAYKYSPSGDTLLIRNSFEPFKFVNFIAELSENPNEEVEKFDIVIAKAQLKAFDRFRGCNLALPEFNLTRVSFEEEEDVNITVSALKKRKSKPKKEIRMKKREEKKLVPDEEDKKKLVSEEDEKMELVPEEEEEKKLVPEEKGKKKRKVSEILEKNEAEKTPSRVNKVRLGGPTGSSSVLGKNKKKKRLDSLGDLQSKFKSKRKFSKVGECMLRASHQVSNSPSPVSKSNSKNSQKRKSLSQVIDKKKSIEKSCRKKKEALREKEGGGNEEFSLEEYLSSSEMLSQLSLAGRDPLKGYSFIPMITSFFTGFRGFIVDASSDDEKPVQVKRGRKKSVSGKSNSPGNETPDSEEKPSRQKKKAEPRSRPTKKRNRKEKEEINVEDKSGIPNEESGNEKNPDNNSVISDANGKELGNEKKEEDIEIEDECMPTALVLNFTKADAVPSKMDLNGFFTRFGPLKENETGVLKDSCRAQVVFKKGVDAELAFSNAGKVDVFGKALVSFSLASYLPSSSNVKSTQEEKVDVPVQD